MTSRGDQLAAAIARERSALGAHQVDLAVRATIAAMQRDRASTGLVVPHDARTPSVRLPTRAELAARILERARVGSTNGDRERTR